MASDHGVSEAIYLEDPDQNGVELYCDRPRDQWVITDDGSIEMVNKALDLEGLLSILDHKYDYIIWLQALLLRQYSSHYQSVNRYTKGFYWCMM